MTEAESNAAPMRLRAETPRVTRLSRKVLAGVTAVALVGIGGALIYALQTRDAGKDGEELYSTGNRQPADGLAGLPKDYTGPILGPALPGDLGRPILDAQNKGQPVVPPTIVTPTVDEAEQRRRAEEEAARTSTVFFQSRAGSTAMNTTASTPGLPGFYPAMQPGQQTAQDRQLAFLNAAADRRTVTPDRVTPPASPFVLQAGAVIPAALITGIRSDLPGQITAQVTETIYDSPTGRILLSRPGETLSFWRLVGRPIVERGFREGMELAVGRVRGGIGGGLCQVANLIQWLALHSPLEVTKRSNHSFDPFPDQGRVIPYGTGAALLYNFVDLWVRNHTTDTFQLRLWLTDILLNGEMRCNAPSARPLFAGAGNMVSTKRDTARDELERGWESRHLDGDAL